MLGENAGVKILWVWAIGTAAVLCTVGIKKKMEEMEYNMNDNLKQMEMSSENTVVQIEGEGGAANDFKNN
eukprot:Gb_16338 [translate_table: standard]